jgi:exopolyphosphatase/guanosine-5'-triphosphate,3'-diphosphate pyrophosphatase
MRSAGIDIGTNSVRLLIGDVTFGAEAVRLETLERLMTITRLGEGVDRSGTLKREAIERTLGVLSRYRDLIVEKGARACRVAATSVLRDAGNREAFLSPAREMLGTEPQVLSGGEEACLSFTGATYDLDGLWPESRSVLVVDIGGGSTELIVGSENQVRMRASVDVGCVRMSERFIRSDPPGRDELREMERFIRGAIGGEAEKAKALSPELMVGLAGTITTLAGLEMGLENYQGELTHHSWLSRKQVERLYRRLASLGLKERRDFMKLEPGRADIIIGGTAVLRVLLEELEIERFLVSEKDILDALAITAAQGSVS